MTMNYHFTCRKPLEATADCLAYFIIIIFLKLNSIQCKYVVCVSEPHVFVQHSKKD